MSLSVVVWAVATSIVAVVDFFLAAIIVALFVERPNISKRREFDDYLASTHRAQAYVLSILSAVALGFLISLAASYVHDGFDSTLARAMGRFEPFYPFGLLAGIGITVFLLLLLLEKTPDATSMLIRSPMTINAAAMELQKGRGAAGLTPATLDLRLDRWAERAGASAMGIALWAGPSPRTNRVLSKGAKSSHGRANDWKFAIELMVAAARDYPIRMFLFGLSFVAVFAAGGFGMVVAGTTLESGARGVIRIFLSLIAEVALLALVASIIVLRAQRSLYWWRIQHISFGAAGRRISQLRSPRNSAESDKPSNWMRFIPGLRTLFTRTGREGL